MYAVYDEGFEEDGAVVGITGEFVDHASGWRCAAVWRMDTAGEGEEEEAQGLSVSLSRVLV